MTPAELRQVLLETCAPKLVAAGAGGLQMNVADDWVKTPSPSPNIGKPFVAQVNLWLDDTRQRQPHEDILRNAGFEIAGYRVDDWLYTEYGENPHAARRNWSDGQRSPGIVAVTLLQRPKRIPTDEWIRRWFGWQSPMSEWMQPRARYSRNLVEEVLTPGAFPYGGIVEEAWPSHEHVVDKLKFFGARNYFELIRNMGIMLRSVTRMLNLFKIMTVMTSEYFVKTPTVVRQRQVVP
jgi:hypothetical protein